MNSGSPSSTCASTCGLQHSLPGQYVRVRPAEEILRTLDADGTLEGLPFMPEMLEFCGQTFEVYKRAHKTCDSIEWSGLRRMEGTVHLKGLRCDGGGHGGCQASCLLFWKEAWLEPVASGNGAGGNGAGGGAPVSTATRDRIEQMAVRGTSAAGEILYRCQATELLRATSPLSWSDPRQYVRDMRDNGVSFWNVLRGVAISIYNRLQKLRNGATYPDVRGQLKRTPTETLGLQPGEWVEVKSRQEIMATLDTHGKNRGLSFDPEMLPYCGGRYQVLRVIEQIVDEPTGRLVKLPGRSVILDHVVCTAHYHRFCPRSTYPYWREIWLRRVTV